MDGITSDIIKLGRQIVLTYLTNIFNNIPKTKQTPDSRHEAKIVSLFKQGDPKTSRTKAYKPPATHRLLQTIIKRSLDENWPEEQAGFRKCYSTSRPSANSKPNNRQVKWMQLNTMHRSIEENQHKRNKRKILQTVYFHATARIHLDKLVSDDFPRNKGVSQGDLTLT